MSAIPAPAISFAAAATRSPACPIAPTIRGSRISRLPNGGATNGQCDKAFVAAGNPSRRLAEAVVQRITGAADGADRIGGVAAIERLTQTTDMDVDGALVDIDVAAPHALEKLLAGEHTAGPLHEKFQEPEFGRTEIDGPAGARDALFLPIKLEIPDVEHQRDSFRTGRAHLLPSPRQQLRHRKRLDDVVVGAGGQPAPPFTFLAARGEHDDGQRLGLRPRPQP